MLNINEIYKLSAAHKALNIGDTVLVKSLDTSRQIIKCGEIKGVYDWGYNIFSYAAKLINTKNQEYRIIRELYNDGVNYLR